MKMLPPSQNDTRQNNFISIIINIMPSMKPILYGMAWTRNNKHIYQLKTDYKSITIHQIYNQL